MQHCIVVADDDPVILDLVKLRLGLADYNVLTASDAVAASVMVRNKGPAAVILDVQTVMRAMEDGANDYMIKPFHPDALLERVSRLVGGGEQKSTAVVWEL